jgi:dihydrofolate synthase/folylpolyglutamate synthase
MRQLGNTLAAIAREKAGIIKPGVPVVCGVLQPEPQTVIAQIAREHGCRLIQLENDFGYRYSHPEDRGLQAHRSVIRNPKSAIGLVDFDYRVPGQEFAFHDASLGMRGPHQAANAAVALAVISELKHQGWCISTDAMRTGLSQAALAGRVEVFHGEPTVVLDSAHNPASARALISALDEMPAPSRRTIVLSISHDKDVRAIVRELAPHFDRFVITQYQDNPRAISPQQLAHIVSEHLAGVTAQICISSTPREAWQFVRESAIPRECICITGSFYLVAEMRRLVLMSSEPAIAGR